MKLIFSFLLIIGLTHLTGCGATSSSSSQSTPDDTSEVLLDSAYYTDVYGWNSHRGLNNTLLGRGINMGNYLDSPTYEGEWNGNQTIQAWDFDNIYQAGFASVRIPIRWSAYAGEQSPYTIDPDFLSRVQAVVDQAIASGLRVIINTHHYNELFYNQGELALHQERLKSIWNQVAQQFPLQQYPKDQLIFELLNEPHAQVGVEEWNQMIEDLVTVLWEDNAAYQTLDNSQRKIMIGTADWGGPFKLPELQLPEACHPNNTLITVHFYEPFQFTHQGASWVDGADQWVGTRWLGTEAEQQVLFNYLDAVTEWNEQPGRGFEINLGEFGVYSQASNPEDQKAWTAFIAREAEKRNFSWHYWEYSSGFGAYDPSAQRWRSALIGGLIPSE